MTRSLTFRLTWQFAALVTLTTAVVLVVGGWLLQREAVRGIELMHQVEANELAEVLGSDATLSAAAMGERMVDAHDADGALYFIQVHNDKGVVLFRSANLGDAILPDLSAQELHATTLLPGVGNARVSEFHAGPWHIQLASPLAPVERMLVNYERVSGILVVGIMLVSLGLGYGFSRITLRPVRAIEQTARRIGADNLRERIPVPATGDEVASLTRLLNEMFDRLESSFEQVQRFTADASHELKTPLALVRLNAERLRTRVAQDPEAADGVDALLEELARMNRIIESLLFIAKADGRVLALEFKEHAVSAFLAPFVEDAQVLAEDRGAAFVLSRDDAGTMRMEPALLRQLLLNVVSNALKVSPSGGCIELVSERTESGWRFTVTDEGPGLPLEHCEKIFERFVRYEVPSVQVGNRSQGHGLGLAICRSIAELHRGKIWAENRRDGRSGLRVVVEWPL
jgi:signal transduction histidine kinase